MPVLDKSLTARSRAIIGGAFGAGLVLIVLPCAAIIFKMKEMSDVAVVGLAMLAIFGIMILFGALAITSSLFEGLGLSDRDEALALPKGSVRAAIALSLIVLFAIIAIMLYQSSNRTHAIDGLTRTEMVDVLRSKDYTVLGATARCAAGAVAAESNAAPSGAGSNAAPSGTGSNPNAAPSAAAGCPEASVRYSVEVAHRSSTESADLAKQLLILIGTLMTSVTSFYFASRSGEAMVKNLTQPPKDNKPEDQPDSGSAAPDANPATASALGADNQVDGCDVAIADPTPDHELPAARGGVSPS